MCIAQVKRRKVWSPVRHVVRKCCKWRGKPDFGKSYSSCDNNDAAVYLGQGK